MRLGELPTGRGRFYQGSLPHLPSDAAFEHFIVRGLRPCSLHPDEMRWFRAQDHVAVVVLPNGHAYIGKSLLHPSDAAKYNRKYGFYRATAQCLGRAVIGEAHEGHPLNQYQPYAGPVRGEDEKHMTYRSRVAEWLSELGVLPHGKGRGLQEAEASGQGDQASPL